MDGVGLGIAEPAISVVVEVATGTDEDVKDGTLKVARDGGAEKLAQVLPRMEDPQVAHLMPTQYLTYGTEYMDSGANPALSLWACERLKNGEHWALE